MASQRLLSRSYDRWASEHLRTPDPGSFAADDECPICLETWNDIPHSLVQINTTSGCRHIFCRPCLKKWILQRNMTCPMCRRYIVHICSTRVYPFTDPTISLLVSTLHEIRDRLSTYRNLARMLEQRRAADELEARLQDELQSLETPTAAPEAEDLTAAREVVNEAGILLSRHSDRLSEWLGLTPGFLLFVLEHSRAAQIVAGITIEVEPDTNPGDDQPFDDHQGPDNGQGPDGNGGHSTWGQDPRARAGAPYPHQSQYDNDPGEPSSRQQHSGATDNARADGIDASSAEAPYVEPYHETQVAPPLEVEAVFKNQLYTLYRARSSTQVYSTRLFLAALWFLWQAHIYILWHVPLLTAALLSSAGLEWLIDTISSLILVVVGVALGLCKMMYSWGISARAKIMN